jgi:hypothetical protein
LHMTQESRGLLLDGRGLQNSHGRKGRRACRLLLGVSRATHLQQDGKGLRGCRRECRGIHRHQQGGKMTTGLTVCRRVAGLAGKIACPIED